MIQTTRDASHALLNQKNFRFGNTEVANSSLHLFNGKIATYKNGILTMTNRGFLTLKTKELLNAVLDAFESGLKIFQEKGAWFFSDNIGRRTSFPFNTWINITELMKGAS